MNTETQATPQTTTPTATAEAAARYRARLAQRKARKARKANNSQHLAAVARRTASNADALRSFDHMDALMAAHIEGLSY